MIKIKNKKKIYLLNKVKEINIFKVFLNYLVNKKKY